VPKQATSNSTDGRGRDRKGHLVTGTICTHFVSTMCTTNIFCLNPLHNPYIPTYHEYDGILTGYELNNFLWDSDNGSLSTIWWCLRTGRGRGWGRSNQFNPILMGL
jgi:hypothetical protein